MLTELLNKSVTAEALASILDGQIEGDSRAIATYPSKIEEGKEGSICFLSNKKYVDFIYNSDASIVVIDKSINLSQQVKPTLIWVSDAYSAFSKLLELYNADVEQYNTHTFYLHPTAKVDPTVSIAPNCFVGKNVRIGKNCIIHPNVTIYHDCVIGNNCIIQSGAVIGADGFGFAPQADGSYKKIPQIGNVIIGNDAEIGANVTIDRATMGSTKIGNGVKLDNLIQIAHNVIIKDNTVIAAQTGIAGSTTIKENCMIGGQVGIVGHIEIAAGTKIQAQSGVAKSIKEPNKAWNDTPAFEYGAALRSQVIYKKLPAMLKRIDELEKEIERLKKG